MNGLNPSDTSSELHMSSQPPYNPTKEPEVCPWCAHRNVRGTLVCGACRRVMVQVDGTTTRQLREDITRRLVGVHTLPDTPPPPPSCVRLRLASHHAVLKASLDAPLILGRSDEHYTPTVDLSPYDALKNGVSRQHAQLYCEEGVCYLKDLGSANGTFVNEKWVHPGQPCRLQDGDMLRLGAASLQVFIVRRTSQDGAL